MTKHFKAALLVLAVAATGLASNPAVATQINVTDPFHYLDNVADNSVGIPTGIRQQFGAVSVIPNGDNGTTGIACQKGVCLPLIPFPFDTAPNFFGRSIAFNPNLTGSWTLTFTNGPDTSDPKVTPTIVGAQVVPFVNSVTISGSGSAPSFNWTVPNTFAPDGVEIRIRDTTDFIGTGGGVGGNGVANVIYNNIFPSTTTNFTVNPSDPHLTQPLQQGRTYSLEINLVDTRDNQAHGNNANLLSDSRAFFDFSLLPAGAPPKVVLPTLVLGATPYYSFNTSVVGGQTVFIDPLVAIGYDYQIGAGDPNFASVLLPMGIGDNLFDLWLWDGTQFIDSGKELMGGIEYDFGGVGVDRFRILGIETSAGLDPNNTTAFITGLKFVADGHFTGTMTPLTAQVPEPSAFALFGLGLAWLGLLQCRQRA
jgi:hypothetical protein